MFRRAHVKRSLRAALWILGWLAYSAAGAVASPEERLFPPPSTERVAWLLKEIEAPTERANHDGMMPMEKGSLERQVMDGEREYYRGLQWVEELADATTAIDAELLRIARKGEPFHARCRAARTLLVRRHPEASSILDTLTKSSLPEERYVAWSLCREQAETTGTPPVSATAALARLDDEPADDVAERILFYLGEIRAREALPRLLAWAREGRHATEAVWALGDLRAPEAIPTIVAARADGGYKLVALGKIGTKEAVDYILARISDYPAMDALVDSGDPRGLAAVEAELARLRALPADKRDLFDERQAEIGRLRLLPPDPVAQLLTVAEDVKADLELRRSAVVAVRQNYPSPSYETRLTKLYARDVDPEILEQCWMAFRDSRAPGVTEAMLHHAVVWQPHMKSVDPAPIIRSINRRLGTSYATLDEVRALAKTRGVR